MTNAEAPLWRAILDRLNPPPASMSLDSVLAALNEAVGRGTLQRIKAGVPGTQLKSIKAIAAELGCDPAELISIERGEAPPSQPMFTVGQVALYLAAALQNLDPRRREATADAIASMLKIGPGETEVRVIDTWAGGLSLPLPVNVHAPKSGVIREDSPAAPLELGISPGRAAASPTEEQCQNDTRPKPVSPLAEEQQTTGRRAGRRRA